MASRGRTKAERSNETHKPPSHNYSIWIAGLEIEIEDHRVEPKLQSELAHMAYAIPHQSLNRRAASPDNTALANQGEAPDEGLDRSLDLVDGESKAASILRVGKGGSPFHRPMVHLTVIDEPPQGFRDPGTSLEGRVDLADIDGRMEDRTWHAADGDWLELSGFDFGGRHSAASGKAVLWLHQPSRMPAGARIEYFIRLITALEVFDAGGLFLHAAGVRIGSLGHVFLGPSGSGKTTLAGHLQASAVLNDDLIIVLPTDQGQWRVVPTPFHNPSQVEGACTRSLPLAGLYRLRQSEENRLTPQSDSVAIAEVMACTPLIGQTPARKTELFSRAKALVEALPAFYDLHLRPDKSVWELFRA